MGKSNKAASLAKRKQAKKNKRKEKIRISQGSRIPERKKSMSMKRLKENMKLLPKLAFEPEIEAVNSLIEYDALIAGADNDVKRIELFAPPEYSDQIKSAVDEVESRLHPKRDKVKYMNILGLKHLMGDSSNPALFNPLIVSKYFIFMDQHGANYNLDSDSIVDFIDKFYIENEEMLDSLQDSDDSVETTSEEVIQPETVTSLSDDELLNEFSEFLKSAGKEDDMDEHVGNAEAFYVDYIQEDKKLSSEDQIKPRFFRFFYERFFPDNMSPTQDDIKSMAVSLELFAEFLVKKEILNENDLSEIKEIFIEED